VLVQGFNWSQLDPDRNHVCATHNVQKERICKRTNTLEDSAIIGMQEKHSPEILATLLLSSFTLVRRHGKQDIELLLNPHLNCSENCWSFLLPPIKAFAQLLIDNSEDILAPPTRLLNTVPVLFDGLARTGNKRPLRNLPSSRPCRNERATTTHETMQRKEAQRERNRRSRLNSQRQLLGIGRLS
jgi:hypothetical protein